MSLRTQIESLLFISPKPISVKRLIEFTSATKNDILETLKVLMEHYNHKDSGVNLIKQESNYQMVTAGENRSLVEEFVKEEITGDLTRPSIETLTIIAYRGPMTKIEIELIRGINCSLILRNLLMRGLIETKEDKKLLETYYSVSLNFLKYLGLNEVKELPEYTVLHTHESIEKLLDRATPEMSE